MITLLGNWVQHLQDILTVPYCHVTLCHAFYKVLKSFDIYIGNGPTDIRLVLRATMSHNVARPKYLVVIC